MGRILFVTGTDTEVGKTLLTALLLKTLRQHGVGALAMKPFCTGDRGDVAVLQACQRGELTDDEANPIWLKAPLAPQLAASLERRRLNLKRVLKLVLQRAASCDLLLVEGVGGVLVPLAEGTAVADFAAALSCEAVLVGWNRLGVINHVRLSLEALAARGVRCRKLVLMEPEKADASSSANGPHLRKTLEDIELFQLPYLGAQALRECVIEAQAKKFQKVLARICGPAIFSPRSLERSRRSGPTKQWLQRS